MKLALADRDVYYADPLFVDVPLVQLLSQSYADVRRPLIDPLQASIVQRPGDPRRNQRAVERNRDAPRPGWTSSGHDDVSRCGRSGQRGGRHPSGWSGVSPAKQASGWERGCKALIFGPTTRM